MRIECGPCIIRSWESGDVGSLSHHASSPAIWANVRDRFPHPYTLTDAEAWVALARSREPERDFAIDVDGVAVGGIGLMLQTDVQRVSAEIGFWLGEAYWGRGIVTAAIRALSSRAFGMYGLTRIFAVVFAGNTGSQRALEKAGYVQEGLLRRSAIKQGTIRDEHLYALLRD